MTFQQTQRLADGRRMRQKFSKRCMMYAYDRRENSRKHRAIFMAMAYGASARIAWKNASRMN
jgi:hypothetical protein